MKRVERSIALLLSAGALSGCVAAAVPVVAGGLVAKRTADGKGNRQAGKPRLAATSPAAKGREDAGSKAASSRTRDAAAPVPAAAPAAIPLPADPREMRPGVTYTGSLPSPYATPTAETTPAGTKPATSTWTDIGRYVAALPATQANSALLARGSSSDAPAWAPCGNKPRAVLARLETAARQNGSAWTFAPQAQQWLEALQTLEVPVIFTSAAPLAARGDVEAAFRGAGLAKLLDLGGLRLGLGPAAMPAERAAIAAV